MVGWHHWLNGHEFEQALGTGDRQGSLACCSPWGCRVGHDWATELTGQRKYLELKKLLIATRKKWRTHLLWISCGQREKDRREKASSGISFKVFYPKGKWEEVRFQENVSTGHLPSYGSCLKCHLSQHKVRLRCFQWWGTLKTQHKCSMRNGSAQRAGTAAHTSTSQVRPPAHSPVLPSIQYIYKLWSVRNQPNKNHTTWFEKGGKYVNEIFWRRYANDQ